MIRFWIKYLFFLTSSGRRAIAVGKTSLTGNSPCNETSIPLTHQQREKMKSRMPSAPVFAPRDGQSTELSDGPREHGAQLRDFVRNHAAWRWEVRRAIVRRGHPPHLRCLLQGINVAQKRSKIGQRGLVCTWVNLVYAHPFPGSTLRPSGFSLRHNCKAIPVDGIPGKIQCDCRTFDVVNDLIFQKIEHLVTSDIRHLQSDLLWLITQVMPSQQRVLAKLVPMG